jgi:hypothetical protein
MQAWSRFSAIWVRQYRRKAEIGHELSFLLSLFPSEYVNIWEDEVLF